MSAAPTVPPPAQPLKTQALTTQSLTAQLCALIAEKPITAQDLSDTALFALDAIGAILGGRTSPIVQPLLQWASAEPATAGREALVLGALSTVLEMDAMHRGSAIHAGIVVVPAALAMARRTRSRGQAFLTAVLRGSEAAIRIGAAVGPAHYRLYQNTATCGPYGAALATASLMGLGRSATVHALGNAGTQAGGLWEFLADASATKQLHAGRAAEMGVEAAQLAARGFTGPSRILEGDRGFFRAACPGADPAAVLRDPGMPWRLRGISFKPWPSPRHTHPAIDAALRVRGDLHGRPIERVEVDTYEAAIALCDEPEPHSGHAARFSIRYCVAAALADGHIDRSSFDEEARRTHAALCRKISTRAAEPFVSAYPRAWGAEVRVHLSDGAVISRAVDHAKGDPEAAMTPDEIAAKARRLMTDGGVADPEALIAGVLNMVEDGPVPAVPLAWPAER